MIDVAYDNVVQFDMLNKNLEGRELLESKVSPKTKEGKKEFENVVKLYFNLDNLKDKKINIEIEKYVSDNLQSNKRYLYYNPSRAGAFIGVTSNYIRYILTVELSKDKKSYKPLQLAKFSLLNLYRDISNLKTILFKMISFYRYDIKDKNVSLNFVYNGQNITSEEFFNKFNKLNIFTIGYIQNGQKKLLCDSDDYIEHLLIENKKSIDNSRLKIEGVCDFCKKTKKLVDDFGAGNYPLKNLKNFTSTMPSVFYENNKKTLYRNIRCCIDCFKKIEQADYSLDTFKVGILREECINCKNKQRYFVYGFIDVPFEQKIDFQDIEFAVRYLFGDKEALTTLQKAVKNEEIFDEDWKVILNIFIAKKTDKINQSILNLRNINPHLFKKYTEIFSYINDLNNELTYRNWKGNFSDIFSTISKADKRVSFEVFEAFLNEKSLNTEGLIKWFVPLIKKKFLTSGAKRKEDPYKTHYKYLLLDITNILIVDNLRKKEDVVSFEIESLVESYENDKNEKWYRKKTAKEIAQALGFEWSDLEIGLFDLGMIIQETVSEIKSSKSTDIEKIFMRKMDFTGMQKDDVMNYIGYLESKFQDYKNFIYNLDKKRERLSNLGVALNKEKNETGPEKSAYLIAFGYEFSTTISNKIRSLINKEKEQKQEENENGNK